MNETETIVNTHASGLYAAYEWQWRQIYRLTQGIPHISQPYHRLVNHNQTNTKKCVFIAQRFYQYDNVIRIHNI